MYGVGYHHAGMDVTDRKAVEALFTAGELPVLCMYDIYKAWTIILSSSSCIHVLKADVFTVINTAMLLLLTVALSSDQS